MEYKEIIKSAYYHDNTGMLLKGDCLEIMKDFPDKSVDMILCDLPYEKTTCKWDTIIPFKLLWEQYERIIKDNGAIVLTASQPFTTELISSNLYLYKYNWVWEKDKPTNFVFANKQPMKYHEDICVFYKHQPTYNKQMIERSAGGKARCKTGVNHGNRKMQGVDTIYKSIEKINFYDKSLKNPSTIIYFNTGRRNDLIHPTQKPTLLFEYLIKTYTNENDIVLDNAAGSCTAAIACKNTNRRWICIEKEEEYCNKSVERIKEYVKTR